MSKYISKCFALVAAVSVVGQSASAACNIEGVSIHPTRSEGDRRIYGDKTNLFFTSGLAVNTDGAVTSYHPQDPWGDKGVAINTICNGANVRDAANQVLDYRRCTELIRNFDIARSKSFAPNALPQVEFYAVATKNARPCVVPDGPYKGYFVSTTSLIADPSKDVCDPARYLDSLTVPFSIYPNHANFTDNGVNKGDIVVTYNPTTDRIEYSIIGDRGPKWGLAEGSVYMAKTLSNRTKNPKSRKEVYRFALPKVHTLMLPSASVSQPFTAEKIQAAGKAAFESWGGMSRMRDCISTLGTRP
jgi:hypothetical protein